jgi:cytidine deaminase
MSKSADMSLLDAMFAAAKAAQAKAYVPYSRFRVGAAVLGDDGQIYSGCNVENAAYPTSTCAEAGAVAAMILAGVRRIEAVLVIGDGTELCTPCGNCRQRLREFGLPSMPIHVADSDGVRQSFTLDQLLPYSFGPDNLIK